MKKLLFVILMTAFVTASFAVPARFGVVKTLKLADGTEVTARLVGDETMHYFVTAEGKNMSQVKMDFIMRQIWILWRNVRQNDVPK